MTQAYCLLGSNLGDRADYLREAAFQLAATPRTELTAASHIYETPAWGVTEQPAFLNAAIALTTSLSPHELLERFLDIERSLGRKRNLEKRWGPRVIDIDMGLYGDLVLGTYKLTLPHPRLYQRAFALVPLLEIVPDLIDPATGDRYTDHLNRLEQRAVASCVAGEPLIRDAADPAEAGLYLSRSSDETQRLASALGTLARGGEAVALTGNLGAGKTCFAGGFARGLGIQAAITSPSYVLVKTYEGGRLILHHADFYRLAGAASGEPPDLASLGLEDYLDDPDAVVLVEWADRFPAWLEPPFWHVGIVNNGPESRILFVRRVERASE